MMEGSIHVKRFIFSVLVSGQQLTQIKTFRVRIRRHVERITLCFSNTKESAIKMIFHHERSYFLCPLVMERITLKIANGKDSSGISIKSADIRS